MHLHLLDLRCPDPTPSTFGAQTTRMAHDRYGHALGHSPFPHGCVSLKCEQGRLGPREPKKSISAFTGDSGGCMVAAVAHEIRDSHMTAWTVRIL